MTCAPSVPGPVTAAIERHDPRGAFSRRLPSLLVMAVVVMAVVVSGLGIMILLTEEAARGPSHGPHWWGLSPLVSLLLVMLTLIAARAWKDELRSKAFAAWLSATHPDDASLARLTLSSEEDSFYKEAARRHLDATRPTWRLVLPTHPMPDRAPSGLTPPPYPDPPVPWAKVAAGLVGAVASLVVLMLWVAHWGAGRAGLALAFVMAFYAWALTLCGLALWVIKRAQTRQQADFRAALAPFSVSDLLYWQGSPEVSPQVRTLMRAVLSEREPGWSSRPDVPLWLLAYETGQG